MSYGYIYKTTNLVNGRVYIGQCKGNLDRRYLGSGIALKNAVAMYGRDSFATIMVGQATDKKLLDILERYYIAFYRAQLPANTLYNISVGGSGGSHWDAGKYPPNVIENLKRGQQKRKQRDGYVISPETRAKHNLALLSERNPSKSPEVKEKIRISNTGKRFSPEHRANLGMALKGRVPWNKGIKGLIKDSTETKLNKRNARLRFLTNRGV